MMKKKKNRAFLLGSLLLISLSSAALALDAAPSKKVGAASFILESKIKDFSLLRDGIMSEASASQIQNGTVGLNELLVTAPGYGVRKIRFWLQPGPPVTIRVDLAKIKGAADPNWQSSDKALPPSRLSKLPSICTWYQEKTNDGAVCHRSNWSEDLALSEPPLFPLEEMRTLAAAQELTEFRRLVRGVGEISVPATTNAIEALYARRAGMPAVMQLAALHSLLRGDCQRVHAIWVDAQQVLEAASGLTLYKALCAELREQNDGALSLLNEELKTNKAPPAHIYYHAGRLQLNKTPQKAFELATECLKRFRFDLACRELGAMAGRLAGKDFKPDRFNLEDGTFKLFLVLEEILPKRKAEAAFFKVLPLLNGYPQNLESYLFLNWIDAVSGFPPESSYFQRKIESATALGGPTLDKIVEALEKAELSPILIPIYRLKLKSDANDPNLWLRLIRAYSKDNRCDDIFQAFKQAAAILPKFSAPLLQIQASCYVQKEKFKSALEIYLKIVDLKPKSWSTYYNLAAVYERLKMPKEALTAYQQTLTFNPPSEIKDNVQFRLLELQADPPVKK